MSIRRTFDAAGLVAAVSVAFRVMILPAFADTAAFPAAPD